ncbi:MAG: hypothetical protein DRK00_07680 [Thermoprotei archaeon]|nr:MAG: hypothetical protein DRK00_07680 [Thermoprotei archaeon]
MVVVSSLNLLVLIVGMVREEVGKTALAEGLAAGLRELGFRVGVMKPMGFLDWYRDYPVVREGAEEGMLASREAFEVRLLLGLRDPPELLNPLAGLVVPLNLKAFYEYRVPRSFFVYQADIMRRTVVLRVTTFRAGEPVSQGYVNRTLLEKGLTLLSRDDVRDLLKRVNHVEEVYSPHELAAVAASRAPEAVRSCLAHLSTRYRLIIVEGLGDAAWPLSDLSIDVHAVVAVAPGVAVAYDPERYKLAVKLKAEVSGEVRLEDIADYLVPRAYFRLPPLNYGELPETRAEKISPLIDYVARLAEA